MSFFFVYAKRWFFSRRVSFVTHWLLLGYYPKVPKFDEARNLCCNLSKIQRGRNLKVFCQNDANGMANSADPDQTAP